MGTSEVDTSERDAAGRVSGDVVGGVLTAILGLIHLYGLQLGGAVGFVVLLVVWPLVGGALGAWFEAAHNDREWATTSVLAGVFGAIVATIVVLLTGLAGAWSGFITTWFGVTLWPVVLSVGMELIIGWAVFAYTGGFIVSLVTTSAEETTDDTDETEETTDESEETTDETEETTDETDETTDETDETTDGTEEPTDETDETTDGIEKTASGAGETTGGTEETA